ncbi:hypothetical protein GALMADRAFT_213568 [Galerina marginata CBS 339.88]|uniref:Uncharacterized protein n=1 Tax=Galerina marginata (strain CBS 339.88) TaxID=685588 RepID=A0A067SMK1_GALM3|nr:hypothetical protein GALMADRAFT_213568 [Galerina marginata CBS 339.88]
MMTANTNVHSGCASPCLLTNDCCVVLVLGIPPDIIVLVQVHRQDHCPLLSMAETQMLPRTLDEDANDIEKPTGQNEKIAPTITVVETSETVRDEEITNVDKETLPQAFRASPSFHEFLLSEKRIEHLHPSPKRRRKRRGKYKQRVLSFFENPFASVLVPKWHTTVIITGQLLILLLAWSFYTVLSFKKSISLPFSWAVMARNNPQSVILVATLIATAISAISSFIKILNRVLIFEFEHLWWTFLTVILVLITSTQTAGWSTLITPVPVTQNTALQGWEIDLTNDTYFQEATAWAQELPLANYKNMQQTLELSGSCYDRGGGSFIQYDGFHYTSLQLSVHKDVWKPHSNKWYLITSSPFALVSDLSFPKTLIDYFLTADPANMIIGLGCPEESQLQGPRNYNVDYKESVSRRTPRVVPHGSADVLTDYAILVLEKVFSRSQRLDSNSLTNLFATLPSGISIAPASQYEEFIKGSLEFIATASENEVNFEKKILTLLFFHCSLFVSNILETIRLTLYFGEILSSLFRHLIIETCVAIVSLIIVCAVMVLKRHDRNSKSTTKDPTSLADSDMLEVQKLETGENFDAGDPFHLLAVASAGGITDGFGRELSDIRMKMGHTVRLRLGRIDHELTISPVPLTEITHCRFTISKRRPCTATIYSSLVSWRSLKKADAKELSLGIRFRQLFLQSDIDGAWTKGQSIGNQKLIRSPNHSQNLEDTLHEGCRAPAMDCGGQDDLLSGGLEAFNFKTHLGNGDHVAVISAMISDIA